MSTIVNCIYPIHYSRCEYTVGFDTPHIVRSAAPNASHWILCANSMMCRPHIMWMTEILALAAKVQLAALAAIAKACLLRACLVSLSICHCLCTAVPCLVSWLASHLSVWPQCTDFVQTSQQESMTVKAEILHTCMQRQAWCWHHVPSDQIGHT